MQNSRILIDQGENQALAINITYEASRNVVSDRGGGVSPEVLRLTAPACETRSPELH